MQPGLVTSYPKRGVQSHGEEEKSNPLAAAVAEISVVSCAFASGMQEPSIALPA